MNKKKLNKKKDIKAIDESFSRDEITKEWDFFKTGENDLFKHKVDEFDLINLKFASLLQTHQWESIMRENSISVHVAKGDIFFGFSSKYFHLNMLCKITKKLMGIAFFYGSNSKSFVSEYFCDKIYKQ